MKNVSVYVETEAGKPTDMSLQCLAKGRELADQVGGSLSAIALGKQMDTGSLIAYGADKVHLAEDATLETYIPSAYNSVVCDILRETAAEVLLFPASTQGNDLASLVAAKLGTGCVLDCHSVTLEGDQLLQTRLEYDGKVHSHYVTNAQPQIATLHDGIIDVPEADTSREGEVCPVNVTIQDADLAAEVVNREITAKTVNLKDANIIVTGGAGVGSKENFQLIQQLAEVLGAEIGATRPVVDAGWTDYERQIGQTGTTVKPDLYIACGVSGAVQHRVGIMNSRRIVAINIDSAAPIFRFAHVKIVGDLTQVIPKLIELYNGK